MLVNIEIKIKIKMIKIFFDAIKRGDFKYALVVLKVLIFGKIKG